MKQFIFTTGCMLALSLSFFAQSADAQCASCQGAAVESGIVESGIVDSSFVESGYVEGDFGGDVVEGVPCEGCRAGGRFGGHAHSHHDGARSHIAAKASRIAGLIRGPETFAEVSGDGMVQPTAKCLHPKQTLTNAARDAFSPNPVYAYSNPGLRAGRTHAWNQEQANNYSWHGGYNSWRFGQPTATVVPPTASYQSSYAWGVGQTRSTPIHHQFGRGAGSSGGVGGGQNTPYWPRSTNHFGYYPVRASW